MEQQGAAGGADRQVSKLVQDHQICAHEGLGDFARLALRLLLLERVDEVDCREEPDLLAVVLHRLDAQCGRHMRLSRAGPAPSRALLRNTLPGSGSGRHCGRHRGSSQRVAIGPRPLARAAVELSHQRLADFVVHRARTDGASMDDLRSGTRPCPCRPGVRHDAATGPRLVADAAFMWQAMERTSRSASSALSSCDRIGVQSSGKRSPGSLPDPPHASKAGASWLIRSSTGHAGGVLAARRHAVHLQAARTMMTIAPLAGS